jgi:hypothetical protein
VVTIEVDFEGGTCGLHHHVTVFAGFQVAADRDADGRGQPSLQVFADHPNCLFTGHRIVNAARVYFSKLITNIKEKW